MASNNNLPVNDTMMEAVASKWVFKLEDERFLVIGFNDPMWPLKISTTEKLNLVEKCDIVLKSNVCGSFRASFVRRVPSNEINQFLLREMECEVGETSASDGCSNIDESEINRLLSVTPSVNEPRMFGKLLAPAVFGIGKECQLINQRIGFVSQRGNQLTSEAEELELLFRKCIERKFAGRLEDTTVGEAFIGASQYGAAMTKKYADAQ